MTREDLEKTPEQVRLETESAERWHAYMDRRQSAAYRALGMLRAMYDLGELPEHQREAAKEILEQSL